MQRPRGISSHFSFASLYLPLHRFKGIVYTILTMSSTRCFNVNDNLIARAVSGEGGDQQQHVSSDVEMETRKNARLEARMKELMKALTGVDNGGASKSNTKVTLSRD